MEPTKHITNFADLDLSKRYTYADYLTWWFDERVELIKGFIRKMSPSASLSHQRISTRLTRLFANFLHGKKCEVFYAPFDVRLKRMVKDEESITVVQPDLCVVCNPDFLDEKGCNGAPDLIIEIISPSNSKHDSITKYQLYEEAGVSEYWLVYPFVKIVDVYHLQESKYVLHRKYAEDDVIEVKTLPGLVVPLEEIFEM